MELKSNQIFPFWFPVWLQNSTCEKYLEYQIAMMFWVQLLKGHMIY